MGAETATSFQILAVCGLERLFESVDLVAVTPFEFGELGGEGADDAARGFVSGRGRCRRWGCVLLLGPSCWTRWRIGVQR